MDREAVKSIVDANVNHMLWALQLQDWTVCVSYDAEEVGALASMQIKPRYRQVNINIDPAKSRDEECVLDSLRHELLHTFQSNFENYRLMVCEVIGDEKTVNALDHAFGLACEYMVAHIENMLNNLELQPCALLDRSRKLTNKTLRARCPENHAGKRRSKKK